MGSLSMSMLLAHGPICMGVAEDIRGKGHPDARGSDLPIWAMYMYMGRTS